MPLSLANFMNKFLVLVMNFELSNLINQCAAFYAGGTECKNCVNDKNVRVVGRTGLSAS